MNKSTRHLRLAMMIAVLVVVAAPAMADWQAGVAAFAAGDYATAAENFTAVIQSNPNWPGAYLMLGRCALEQGNSADAVRHLQVAYDLAPDDSDHLVALGRALLANGQNQELLSLLRSVDRASLSPEVSTETTVLMARAERAAGQAGDAVEVLRKGLAADPGNAVLTRSLGLMLKSSGDLRGAVEALARAYELSPEDVASAELAVRLALDLAAEGDGDDRSAWYRRALDLASALATAAPVHENQLLAGEAALGARDLVAAESWFAAAVASRADDSLAWYYLGRTRAALDSDDVAVDNLRRALDASPDADLRRLIHAQLGRVMACQLELQEAAGHYRAAGDGERASRIDEVARSSQDALAALARLRSELAELRNLEGQLRDLGDEQGVSAVGERIVFTAGEIRAIEDNLQEVRSALCS